MSENTENIINIWKEQDEKILVDWADKATCYRWLHNRAHAKFSCRNMWFTIPVIIIWLVCNKLAQLRDKKITLS